MGQFACECTATGSGKDQFDYTDLYVAQFTLPDGSVVYVGGEYDSYGRIECAVEGGGSAKFTIVDGAGGEDAQRFLTGTYQFGYYSTSEDGDDLAAILANPGCGVKIKDEDMVEGVRLNIPSDARDKLQAVVPAATAAKLGLRVTAGTPYEAHHRHSTLGREKTVARIEAYLRMDAAIKAKDQEAFDAAQKEVLADLASVAHERYKIDSAMRRGIYTSAQKDALRQELAAAGVFLPPAPPAQGPDDYVGVGIKIPAGNGFPAVEIPAAPEPWNFESWFADATARREGQDLYEEVKALEAKATPEEFQLDVGGDCMGWDRAKLYKRLGREPSAPPAKSPKGDAEASPSPPSPATPKWSQAEVDAMTVPKLKAALTELGCETTGLKAVLKARLVEKTGL